MSCEAFLKSWWRLFQHLDCVKRIWYLSPMRAAKVQASLRIRAVSPEPPLLAHTSSESRGTSRQKARSRVPLNGWACAVKIFDDGMLEDKNSLDEAHFIVNSINTCTGVIFKAFQGFCNSLKETQLFVIWKVLEQLWDCMSFVNSWLFSYN